MTIERTQTANPTPNRDWDWQATYENYEEGDPIAYGATAELAEEALLLQLDDKFEKTNFPEVI